MIFEKKKNLALVLSGGGARALAHIGVLEVLEENHIPIDAIVGTSMGALVGGLYAAGALKEFKEEGLKISESKVRAMFWSLKFKRLNIDTNKSIAPFLNKFIKNKRIENLGISFTAVATDLKTGKEVFINKGSLLKAILASICLPGIFHPCEFGKKILIDGGVVDPLPQGYGQMIAKKVIAVNAMPKKLSRKEKPENFFNVISEASTIMTNTLLNLQKTIALKSIKDDKLVFIQLDTGERGTFDFYKASELVKIGRKAAQKNLKKIIELSRE